MFVMRAVEKFCEDAVELLIKYRAIARRGKKFNLSQFHHSTIEVYRSLWYNDSSKLLFPIDIDFHKKNPEDALKFSIAVAREIEKRYPGQFLWTFSGRGIHGQTLLHEAMTPEFSALRKRYTDVQILKAMAQNISKDLIGVDLGIYHPRAVWRSVGSINFKTMTYNIPIGLDWPLEEIFEKAKEPPKDFELPVWNMLIPKKGLKSVDPPKHKQREYYYKIRLSPIYFPPCIQLLLQDSNINFHKRKVLLAYLRDVGYSVDEIYKIIRTQYGREKELHIREGREVERFFEADYPTPSCAYIKSMGLCNGCDRTYPLQIDFEVKQERDWDLDEWLEGEE